jgi:hypothetical protein
VSVTDNKRSTTKKGRRPIRSLLDPSLVAQVAPDPKPQPPAVQLAVTSKTDVPDQLITVAVGDLWLEDQPRQIVPAEVLAGMIDVGRNQPVFLLAELRFLASTPSQRKKLKGEGAPVSAAYLATVPATLEPRLRRYYLAELNDIQELAANIQTNGLQEPIHVVRKDDRYVVRSGHRRAISCILIGLDQIPAILKHETSEVESLAKRLVVNIQRKDLPPLDLSRWVYELARKIEITKRAEMGLETDWLVVDTVAFGQNDMSETQTGGQRQLRAEIQDEVCRYLGIGKTRYYELMHLNKLVPAARLAAVGLTERQLRPVIALSADQQPSVVEFISEYKLTGDQATTLVRVIASGNEEAAEKLKESFRGEHVKISWRPLINALPDEDAMTRQFGALLSELSALDRKSALRRYRQLQQQKERAVNFVRRVDEIGEALRRRFAQDTSTSENADS